MRIKLFFIALAAVLSLSPPAFAMDGMDEHGSQTFHAFRLEAEYGSVRRWDFDGWIGGDDNKLWLKTEGAVTGGALEQAELWALYSRNIATFWDAQAGLRHDTQPVSTTYLTLGFSGLAPYHFETEAHLFISNKGDVSARLREENDFLLTQRLIFQPYAEMNLFAQDVPEQAVGAGVSDGEIGLQTRYEITRKFAPYLDFRYERKFGKTSSIAKSSGENTGDFTSSIGLRLMF